MANISAVINVVREEVIYLPRLLNSIVGLVDEIVLIDMTEGDENISLLAEKYNLRVSEHRPVPFVELVRNYGISKTTGKWIIFLDPDEEVSTTLANKLAKIAQEGSVDYVRIPRKNIIFGKWMKHSRWWPDYNIRFFRKGSVVWEEKIHKVPTATGTALELKDKEELALVHYHYESVSQFITRMDRYTDVQAKEIAANKKYKFIWKDLVRKPLAEFLSRYFAGEGYKDGLHGLSLAGLQAFSEAVVYLKVWEMEKFLEQAISPDEIAQTSGSISWESQWWVDEMLIKNRGLLSSLSLRAKRKLSKKKK